MYSKFVFLLCLMQLIAGPASAGIFSSSREQHHEPEIQQVQPHRDGWIKTALKGAAMGAVSSVAYRAVSNIGK